MTKLPPGTSHKFYDKYLGLYIVKKKTEPSNYVIGGSGLKGQVVHVTRLHKYQHDDPLEDTVVSTSVITDHSMKKISKVPAPDPNESSDLKKKTNTQTSSP